MSAGTKAIGNLASKGNSVMRRLAGIVGLACIKGPKLIAQTYVVRPVGIAAASRNEFRMLTHILYHTLV